LPGTIPEPPLKPLPPLPPLKLPPRPQAIAAPQPIPYVPPQPKPKEAETVTVTGTVEIAGQRYAILSVPGDVTSQYVRAGQRIAGDKVLVKSIETYGTPRVVLQQNGVEFTRYIK
jgi:multidrug efflux pump subunit AcrA (membrane-fusion protein)